LASRLRGRRTTHRTCVAKHRPADRYVLPPQPPSRRPRLLRRTRATGAGAASPQPACARQGDHPRAPRAKVAHHEHSHVAEHPSHLLFPCVLALRRLDTLCAFFLTFFAQPVTLIGVDCLIVAPFCAVNAVGIFSVSLHRLPGAANAENLPWGSVSSNVPTGASGTVRNVLLVTPWGLMNVSACN